MSLTDEDLLPVWEAYWADRANPEPIDMLLRAYAHLAGYYARMAIAKAPPHQDRDDLLSYAQHGLLAAIETYELGHGAKFETWAARVIPRRIMDRQRTDDPLTRTMRTKVKLLEAAQGQIEPHTMASIPQLADIMRISEEEVREVLVYSQSMNAELTDDHDHGADSEGYVLVKMAEARAYVAARLAELGPRQRAFTLAYYCDADPEQTKDKSLVQACRELSISPDWARQTRHQVLDALQR